MGNSFDKEKEQEIKEVQVKQEPQSGNKKDKNGTNVTDQQSKKKKKGKKQYKDQGKSGKDCKRSSNHKEWYGKYPEDLNRLIGLNFGRRKSVNVDLYTELGMTGFDRTVGIGAEATVCGVLSTDLVIPKDSTNSIFQAITIMYQKIRSANAGSVNYTPADLFTYVMNARSLRGAVLYLKKIVGMCNYMNPYDSDLPSKLVDSALNPNYAGSTYTGFRSQEVISNRANIINQLNLWINQLNNLLPGKSFLFDRTRWLTSNVFKDSDDIKSNYWQFQFKEFPIYTNSSGVVAQADEIDFAYTSDASYIVNMDATLDKITATINSVITNSTNVIIAGDILKTFGSNSFDIIENVDVNYTVTPIYDESALTQIQNATPVAVAGNNYGGYWTQSANFNTDTVTNVCTVPNTANVAITAVAAPTRSIINANKDTIDGLEQVAYSRLQAFVSRSGGTPNDTYTMKTNGTEVVRGLAACYMYNSNAQMQYFDLITLGGVEEDASLSAITANAWSILDYAPLTMMKFFNKNAATLELGVMYDLNNFAICDSSVIDTLHQIATLSLFAVDTHVERQNKFEFTR